MHSARIQRSIEVILSQAEAAVARQDWDGVADLARRVLAVDDANEDAAAFLHMAFPDLEAAAISAATAPAIVPTPVVAPAVVVAPIAAADIANEPSNDLTAALPDAAPEERDRTSTIVAPPIVAATAATVAAQRVGVGSGATVASAVSPSATDGSITEEEKERRRRRGGLWIFRTPRVRGRLLVLAGLVAVTMAFTCMGATRGRPTPLSLRPAESAGANSAPLAAIETPAPVVESAPVASMATEPASIAAIAPTVPVAPIVPVVVVPPRPIARLYRGTFAGTLGRVTALNGCEWDTPFEANVDATLTRADDGTMSGTGTSALKITYVVTSTPDGATCNGSIVTTEASGPITGDEAHLNGSLTGTKNLAISFFGASNGEALVGDVTLQRTLSTTSSFGTTSVTSASPPVTLVLRGS